jgi:pimeloyl-ACP methyl ester carboxylesterase
MIPVFLETGARVVAPDFFGFGRSDKPVRDADYSFHFHRNFLIALIQRLDLRRITLVVQDWGGLLGLTLPVDPDVRSRISRLLVMNTTLAVGALPSEGFRAWRAYVAANPDLPVGALLGRGAPHLTPAEIAAYDAPFPDQAYKAGVRAFPALVMTEPGMAGVAESLAARDFWSSAWSGPTFMAYGASDPVLGGPVMEALRRDIRGCPEPMIVPEGGHFVQEWGEPIARAAIRAFEDQS